jgi:GNAT superfamily N-acetyltransferase
MRLNAVMDSTYRFSSNTADVDREAVHRWLSDHSYWASGRPRLTQDAAIDGSRNFGMYDSESGRQVAYARVVTDGATFAWLCDVFVHPDVRSRGIGVTLIAGIVQEFAPLGLKRMVLATADAHGLYAKFGFESLKEPTKWMERPGT